MIKKFAAVGVMALTLTTCSSPSSAEQLEPLPSRVIVTTTLEDSLAKIIRTAELSNNKLKIDKAISGLKKYVGKTWYVFSGSSPRGWDCSGLTKWTYEQIGIDLIHSASVQKNSGKQYKTPKVGDIVAFGWKGWSGAGHVGIYIGDGKMIHAPSPGHKTRIESVKGFAKYGYSKITYTRLLKTS